MELPVAKLCISCHLSARLNLRWDGDAVRNVYLSWNSIGDQGAKAFAKTLQVNCYLKTLDLGTFLWSHARTHGDSLAFTLGDSLAFLSLQGSNNITDHGVHFLAAGIRRNKSLDLAELHLENNSISDEAISCIN